MLERDKAAALKVGKELEVFEVSGRFLTCTLLDRLVAILLLLLYLDVVIFQLLPLLMDDVCLEALHEDKGSRPGLVPCW